MRIILLGPPAAGKGTQAENLSKKFNIPTISTGEMIRSEIAAGTQLGERAAKIINGGNLLPDDVRLTKFGKLLRTTSLDELPEAINILKGDMSVIGPRPLLVKYLPLYSVKHQLILSHIMILTQIPKPRIMQILPPPYAIGIDRIQRLMYIIDKNTTYVVFGSERRE